MSAHLPFCCPDAAPSPSSGRTLIFAPPGDAATRFHARHIASPALPVVAIICSINEHLPQSSVARIVAAFRPLLTLHRTIAARQHGDGYARPRARKAVPCACTARPLGSLPAHHPDHTGDPAVSTSACQRIRTSSAPALAPVAERASDPLSALRSLTTSVSRGPRT